LNHHADCKCLFETIPGSQQLSRSGKAVEETKTITNSSTVNDKYPDEYLSPEGK